MKKIGLAIAVFVLIFVIYYMTLGSKQITKEIKQEVNKELVELKQSGFGIKEQNLSENKQHIVIIFNDTNKITQYLNKQSKEKVKSSDIEVLKGMEIGMDIAYMPSAKYAVAMDIYPLKLPNSFYQVSMKEDDKAIVKKLEEIIKERLFVTHININKLLSHFDGYVKDIDKEFIDNGKKVHLISKGLKFEGDIKNEKIESISHKLEILSIQVPNELDINISGLTSNIESDDNIYDNISYNIKSINMDSKVEQPFSLSIKNIEGSSKDKINNNLISSTSRLKITSIDLNESGKESKLETINISSAINNINKKALEKLEQITSQDDNSSIEQIVPIFKEIAKEDISIDIPDISVGKITNEGNTFNGFKIKALAKLDKNFDWKKVDSDPLELVNIIDAKINIEASDELIDTLSNNPQAMIMMMVIQPIDKNGTKYYNIEFKNGSLKINGKPFM